jgi:hypothetical protein
MFKGSFGGGEGNDARFSRMVTTGPSYESKEDPELDFERESASYFLFRDSLCPGGKTVGREDNGTNCDELIIMFIEV